MSRIGRMPIVIPAGVDVKLDANVVTVKGPKGTLTQSIHPDMIVKIEDGSVKVERPSEAKNHKALHGLTRTIIANMVNGCNETFKKTLEINGVGYKAAMEGKRLVLNIGYSHPVYFDQPDGITIEVPNPNTVVVSGADRQKVGQLSAEIRGKRPPEPYLGKGIKYADERIRRKAGKAGK